MTSCRRPLPQGIVERIEHLREFGTEVVGLVLWSLRRNESTGLEGRVLEDAVEPDTNLPGDLEGRERGAVIPDQRMAGGVACSPHFTEELSNLTRKNALLLQSADEIVLRLLRRHVERSWSG